MSEGIILDMKATVTWDCDWLIYKEIRKGKKVEIDAIRPCLDCSSGYQVRVPSLAEADEQGRWFDLNWFRELKARRSCEHCTEMRRYQRFWEWQEQHYKKKKKGKTVKKS